MTQQGDSYYTAQEGDTLSSIAQQVYHDGSQPYWMAIYEANQDTIHVDDPSIIHYEMGELSVA